MTQAYYQAHRREIIEKVTQRHRANSSPTYHKLVQTRKDIWGVKESLLHHRKEVYRLQAKLKRMEYNKEVLELAYGRERAQKKKGVL